MPETSFDQAKQATDEWLRAWENEADEKGLNIYPPGVGNGLIYRFMASMLTLGAIDLKLPEGK